MLIYERIKQLCKDNHLTITGTEAALGFARGSLCKIDKNKPSAEKINKLAEFLNTTPEFLMTGEQNDEKYYLNKNAGEAAQFLFENPEYKVLFDASRNVKKEDIDFVAEMIKRMSNSNSDDTGC